MAYLALLLGLLPNEPTTLDLRPKLFRPRARAWRTSLAKTRAWARKGIASKTFANRFSKSAGLEEDLLAFSPLAFKTLDGSQRHFVALDLNHTRFVLRR